MLKILFIYIGVGVSTGFNFPCTPQSKYSALFAGFGAPKRIDTSNSRIPISEVNCACGTGKTYGDCCQKYHDKRENPMDLETMVRSRFSAYAYGIISYIVDTTHPSHKDYVNEEKKGKRKSWIKDLALFSEEYEFLKIVFDSDIPASSILLTNNKDDPTVGLISFTATLKQKNVNKLPEDVKETSKFIKVKESIWLYADAEVETLSALKGEIKGPKTKLLGSS